MARYLVVSSDTDSVVCESHALREAVETAARLGYVSGYVSNQDGGSGDLAELIERYGLSEVVGEGVEEEWEEEWEEDWEDEEE